MNPGTTINPTHDPAHNPAHKSACDSMPDLTRLRYFHGQMLIANDLQTEQDYFREKLKLHTRCLHGYGTVCGLKVVSVEPEPECDPKTQQQGPQHQQGPQQQQTQQTPQHQQPQEQPACVRIECGLALDCEGNELLVRQPLVVDLWHELTDAERKQIEDKPDKKATLYLSLCYCVQPIDPVRPVLPDACGAISECVYSKLRDSVRVKVSTEKPYEDHCRNNCCEKCEDKCLLLAAIYFEKGKPVTDAQINNAVRRWIAVYEPVTITGINWFHGAAYTPDEAKILLQKRDTGLVINFSRPVLTETITDGVVDVWVIEGGRGRSGNIYNLAGEIILPVDSTGNVLAKTEVLKFRQTTGEVLQDGDRVLVIVRADFILDECCRPVDGNHVGGRVPYTGSANLRHRLRNGHEVAQQRCLTPPLRYGPWVSGDGSTGESFESWFYIKSQDSAPYASAPGSQI
ncbi:MAG: hypothetical protein MOB07_28805 [Acidobacteria bacterium]|nr:hypothetical protein [Acidobacteriota bacterium]